MFVTETTVKLQLVHIFSKLNVSSRTAAVAKARELGVLRWRGFSIVDLRPGAPPWGLS
jgi:hypothetical protein